MAERPFCCLGARWWEGRLETVQSRHLRDSRVALVLTGRLFTSWMLTCHGRSTFVQGLQARSRICTGNERVREAGRGVGSERSKMNKFGASTKCISRYVNAHAIFSRSSCLRQFWRLSLVPSRSVGSASMRGSRGYPISPHSLGINQYYDEDVPMKVISNRAVFKNSIQMLNSTANWGINTTTSTMLLKIIQSISQSLVTPSSHPLCSSNQNTSTGKKSSLCRTHEPRCLLNRLLQAQPPPLC